MPIKFRCSYCHQFLGISRERAGGVVECPSCGRTIRVPGLDGRLKPLPAPEMDLEDPHLSQALDELAALGEPARQPAQTPRRREFDSAEPDDEIPQPIPEPEPIEMPVSPEPVARAVAVQPTSAQQSQAPAVNPQQIEAELSALAAQAPAGEKAELEPAPAALPRLTSRMRGPSGWLLAGAVGLAALALGYWLRGQVPPSPPPAGASAQVEPADQEAAPPSEEPAAAGRITYKTPAGDSLPDSGARVLVFPKERPGSVKLPVVGFRPADEADDFDVTAAALRALGGDAATTDDEGNFEVRLNDAGVYRILVISHYQQREDESSLEPELVKLLDQFFERPDQLLGRLAYRFGQLRYPGTGTLTWDHSF